MATLPPTPNLGLVLPDPGTGEPFSTTQFNGWMTTIDSALANTFTKPRLRLTDTSDASLTSTNHALQIGPTTGANLIMDNNEIMSRDNGAGGNLFINGEGGDVNLGHSSSVINVPGRINNALLPTRMASGSATVTVNAADTTYTKTVTFPSGRFTTTPVVVITPWTGVPHVVFCSISAISSTSFTIALRRSDGATNTDIRWIAVQDS